MDERTMTCADARQGRGRRDVRRARNRRKLAAKRGKQEKKSGGVRCAGLVETFLTLTEDEMALARGGEYHIVRASQVICAFCPDDCALHGKTSWLSETAK